MVFNSTSAFSDLGFTLGGGDRGVFPRATGLARSGDGPRNVPSLLRRSQRSAGKEYSSFLGGRERAPFLPGAG